ncbi:unnamed protein product [Brassica oleracea]
MHIFFLTRFLSFEILVLLLREMRRLRRTENDSCYACPSKF